MSSPKQKLELTWIGKENRPKLEPRIRSPFDVAGLRKSISRKEILEAIRESRERAD